MSNPRSSIHDLRSSLKHAICDETAKACAVQYPDRLRAIVLTGSLAREEATFIKEGKGWRLLGDAEFFLIFHDQVALASTDDLQALRRKIEDSLLGGRVQCHISLGAIHSNYLRKLKPHIFAYELNACGRVVWGEREILSVIPTFSASDIPLEDGWRLLCNRMIEMIEVIDELADKPAVFPQRVYYRTVKLYLDMATSYLLFAGAYEPTYRGRAEKLKSLADDEIGENRFPLRDFAERVIACTRFKLGGSDRVNGCNIAGEEEKSTDFWRSGVNYAARLWRWELAQLVGQEINTGDDRELMKCWMAAQPLSAKMRGWLYVLRKRGWHRSCLQWPHWLRCGWHASPRYWVYAAASELFFNLPRLVRSNTEMQMHDLDVSELCCWLPVTRGRTLNGERPEWQLLASEIVWNYCQFLEETRA